MEFEDLLRQAQQPVLGYLIRLTGSLHAAQDLLQSANVTAIEKRKSFDLTEKTAHSNFVAWLRQIAVNHYRNQVRKESNRARVPLVDEDLHELIEKRYREREELEQKCVDWNRLNECLQKLPDHQKKLMTEFYLHGQPLAQLAESSGRNVNAIGQTLHRARSAIVRCVKRPMEHESNAQRTVHANPVSDQNPT